MTRPRWRLAIALLAVLLLVAACGDSSSDEPAEDGTTTSEAATDSGATETTEAMVDETTTSSAVAQASDEEVPEGRTVIDLATHSGGNPAELENIQRYISDYNNSQDEFWILYEAFPQGDYNETVVALALTDSLPCIIDVDGPNTPNWAWSGYLAPLTLDAGLEGDLLDSVKGYWDGQLYSVGQFDAAVAILARQSDLDELGIRTPTIDEPWTGDEFQEILDTYKDSGKYDFAIDYGMGWTGEWFPYGFSPLLQSFGGDLINRDNFVEAEGVLNGDEAIAWGEWWQSQFVDGYAPRLPANRDEGFAQAGQDGYEGETYGLQWNGIWAANGALENLGDDVVFLPAPDFGAGGKIGGASWQWAVASSCEHPEAASEYIASTLTAENIASIADAQNVLPALDAARPLTEKFAEGSRLSIFYEISAAQALIRPPTPAYTTLALIFEKGAADIADGADVVSTLDRMVDEIEADIEANNGYGFDLGG